MSILNRLLTGAVRALAVNEVQKIFGYDRDRAEEFIDFVENHESELLDYIQGRFEGKYEDVTSTSYDDYEDEDFEDEELEDEDFDEEDEEFEDEEDEEDL